MKHALSVCIPSWNSLEYLKIACRGLRKNSKVNIELIVHDNGSTDGTLEWLQKEGIQHTRSEENLGFAGVNHALKLASNKHVLILNSDMYVLPGWDMALFEQVEEFQKLGIERYTISSCLIEPVGSNPEYSIFYAGHDATSFNEALLLGTFIREKDKSFKKQDTIQYSHPILFTKDMIEEVGYLDEAYFPGWSLDHDMPMSFLNEGCRNFVMKGSSRVYHFVSKTFSKLPPKVKAQDGQDIFHKKWGITVEEFRRSLKLKEKFDPIVEYAEFQ